MVTPLLTPPTDSCTRVGPCLALILRLSGQSHGKILRRGVARHGDSACVGVDPLTCVVGLPAEDGLTLRPHPGLGSLADTALPAQELVT